MSVDYTKYKFSKSLFIHRTIHGFSVIKLKGNMKYEIIAGSNCIMTTLEMITHIISKIQPINFLFYRKKIPDGQLATQKNCLQ